MIFNRKVNVRGMPVGVAVEVHAQKFRWGVAVEYVQRGQSKYDYSWACAVATHLSSTPQQQRVSKPLSSLGIRTKQAYCDGRRP